ncbi:MAG: caspase family protein [Treponema sp.]|nr:caspase family protein [Treponema sp.]
MTKQCIKWKLTMCACFAFFCASLSAQESRNALLIANGKYSHFSSLSEPIKEAENLRVALEQIGFSVKIVKNASLEEMNDALSDFEATLKKSGGTGFFHYGGHAVQVEGKNYLIPSTAEIPDERRVSTRALIVDEVMNSMSADTNIVILDSCRNNPLPAGSGRSASRGLVISSVRPKNSIIVYSAEAGCTAQDGVFTPVLTKEITRKDVSLQAMLINVRKEVQRLTDGAQTPGEYSQMTDIVYLAGKSEEKSAVTNQTGGSITAYIATGSLKVSSDTAGDIYIDGESKGTVRAFGTLVLNNLPAGMYSVEIRGEQPSSQKVVVKENETAEVYFEPKTEHVTAKATESGIAFTIQRPNDESYSAGFGSVIIFKFDKNRNELIRAYVFDGGEEKSARAKKTLNCLFPICEDGEECHFLIDIQPPDGNTNKNDCYKEELKIKAKGGIALPSAEQATKISAFFSAGKPNISVEESAAWKNQKRTAQIIFFAGNGDFEKSGETFWIATHTQNLLPGKTISFDPNIIFEQFKATGKHEFFAELFYRISVSKSKGIRYFLILQSRSNIAQM